MAEKILILGNEAIFVDSLKAKLSADNYEILSNSAGKEINEIILFIKLNKPNYIIQNLYLPRAEDFELLKAIKSDDIISSIPIFVINDSADNKIKKKCDNLGADYFISKNNLNIDDLVKKINKIINNFKKIK